MAAPRTIGVTRSLKEAGFDVWTPVIDMIRRVPRSKNLRSVQVPLLPTFAFAPYMDVPLLLAILADPMRRHPPFSIFRHGDAFPKIADVQLDALREVERKAAERAANEAKRMRPQPRFLEGQSVHAPDGPFAGLEGTVLKGGQGKEGLVLVLFPGMSIPVKIASWHLDSVHVTNGQSEQETAARAA